MKLQEKLRLLRATKGWTQEQVAEKLKMSPNGYGSIERGETNVSLKRLKKIAEIYDIDLTELLATGDKIFCNQMGDNNTTYTNYQFDGNLELNQIELKHEIEKKNLLLTERDKYIAHLEETIRFLENQLKDKI